MIPQIDRPHYQARAYVICHRSRRKSLAANLRPNLFVLGGGTVTALNLETGVDASCHCWSPTLIAPGVKAGERRYGHTLELTNLGEQCDESFGPCLPLHTRTRTPRKPEKHVVCTSLSTFLPLSHYEAAPRPVRVTTERRPNDLQRADQKRPLFERSH